MAITKLSKELGVKPAMREKEVAAQADTVAVDLAALKVDFNLLLAKLRASGLMAD